MCGWRIEARPQFPLLACGHFDIDVLTDGAEHAHIIRLQDRADTEISVKEVITGRHIVMAVRDTHTGDHVERLTARIGDILRHGITASDDRRDQEVVFFFRFTQNGFVGESGLATRKARCADFLRGRCKSDLIITPHALPNDAHTSGKYVFPLHDAVKHHVIRKFEDTGIILSVRTVRIIIVVHVPTVNTVRAEVQSPHAVFR